MPSLRSRVSLQEFLKELFFSSSFVNDMLKCLKLISARLLTAVYTLFILWTMQSCASNNSYTLEDSELKSGGSHLKSKAMVFSRSRNSLIVSELVTQSSLVTECEVLVINLGHHLIWCMHSRYIAHKMCICLYISGPFISPDT